MKTFFLTVIISLNLLFTPQAKAVNLGPFAVTDSFCQDFSKIGGLLNSFQIVQWPVAGAPGIVTGLTQRTSIIHDLCDFLNQLAQLDGVNAVFFSANYLNELTGKKWDHHLKQADKTWNLANSIYDFDNGGVRQGALTSQSTARDLNDWMESTYSWHAKTFNNEEAYIKHRQEREGDMQNFSKASYQKAILKEATNCPTAPDNVNYQKIYSSKIQPIEVKREDYKEDVAFFKQQLYYMGPYFMNNDGELQNYIKGLQLMERDAVTYKMAEKNKNQTTYKNSNNKDAEDHVIAKKQKMTVKTYTYSTSTDTKIFNDFKTKWLNQWGSYVTAKWTSSGSFGALTGDAKQSVENDFIDLGYECNPSRLQRGLNHEAPDYDKQVEKLMTDCKKNTSSNQKKAQNLLEYYVNQYEESLTNFKNSNAAIWTFESESAGINHLVSTQSSTDSSGSTFQQEQVSCSEKLSPAELGLLQVKQNNVQNDLAEMQVKESIKQSTIMETNEIEKNQLRDETQRKSLMNDEKNKNFQKMNENPQAPFKVKGL